MVKSKNKTKRPARKRSVSYSREVPDVEKILIENFVSLQKVMSNLSIKFDDLTTQISKLLQLFEISAKALTEKDYEVEKNNRDNAKILERMEGVLEQNKTIARGLTLINDKISGPQSSPQMNPPQMREKSIMHLAPKAPFKPAQNTSVMEGTSGEYHRSISSNEQ
jgi:hypothetical protein